MNRAIISKNSFYILNRFYTTDTTDTTDTFIKSYIHTYSITNATKCSEFIAYINKLYIIWNISQKSFYDTINAYGILILLMSLIHNKTHLHI